MTKVIVNCGIIHNTTESYQYSSHNDLRQEVENSALQNDQFDPARHAYIKTHLQCHVVGLKSKKEGNDGREY